MVARASSCSASHSFGGPVSMRGRATEGVRPSAPTRRNQHLGAVSTPRLGAGPVALESFTGSRRTWAGEAGALASSPR